MISIDHPEFYFNFVEKKIISQNFWKMSCFEEIMLFCKDEMNIDTYNYFYSLFFPIVAETLFENNKVELKFLDYQILLINHSKENKKTRITFDKSPKIIYFVNNSNSNLKIKSNLIKLNNMKGKSFFIDNMEEMNVFRSDNIQTCLIIFNLKSKQIFENLNYS